MKVSMTAALNTVWIVIAAAMVIFMEGGFSLLEAGFVRSKNAVNATMKIIVDLTFGALAFYVIGIHLMFGKDAFGVVGFGRASVPKDCRWKPTCCSKLDLPSPLHPSYLVLWRNGSSFPHT
jgi:ammonia channel protein AmtB